MLYGVYTKEWVRENGAARIVQMILLFVIPSFTFFFNTILPAISAGNRDQVIYSGSLLLLIVSFIYSAVYRMEIEEKVLEGFPIDYLPLSKSKLFFTQTIFSVSTLSFAALFGFLSALLLLDTVKIQGVQLFAKDAILSFSWPFFAGVPYMILFGVLLGGIFGTLGKKIIDNFPYAARKYAVIFYMVALFLVFRPYVSSLFSKTGASLYADNLLRFSPVAFSAFISRVFSGTFSAFDAILSAASLSLLFGLFFLVNALSIRFLPDITPQASSSKSFSFVSPLWNLVLKRWFSPFSASVLIVWILLSICGALFSVPALKFISIIIIYVYTFIAIDRMFPSKDENYLSVWQSLPVSKMHISGVALGAYYLFYMVPLFIAYSLLDPSGAFASSLSVIPSTFSGFIVKIFPFVTITALIPAVIIMNPFLWSENGSGRIVRKKSVIFYLLFGYTLFSSMSASAMMYIAAPGGRQFIDSVVGANGRVFLKLFFIGTALLSVMLHSFSLYLAAASLAPSNKILTNKK